MCVVALRPSPNGTLRDPVHESAGLFGEEMCPNRSLESLFFSHEKQLAPLRAANLDAECGLEASSNRAGEVEPRLVCLPLELDHGSQRVEPRRDSSNQSVFGQAVDDREERCPPWFYGHEPSAVPQHAPHLADGLVEIPRKPREMMKTAVNDHEVVRGVDKW